MFLLALAHPGSSGQRAVKRLLLLLLCQVIIMPLQLVHFAECLDRYDICVVCVALPEKEDKKAKKKTPGSRKQAKKSKNSGESDEEPMEESDDLDEGEEVDYMSGSSRSPSMFVSWH